MQYEENIKEIMDVVKSLSDEGRLTTLDFVLDLLKKSHSQAQNDEHFREADE